MRRGLVFLAIVASLVLAATAKADFTTGLIVGSMLANKNTTQVQVNGPPCLFKLTSFYSSEEYIVNLSAMMSMTHQPARQGGGCSGPIEEHTTIRFADDSYTFRGKPEDVTAALDACKKGN